MSETTTYNVEGMSCAHCVTAVSGELARIRTVTGVDVDLATGKVAVTSSEPLDASTVQHVLEDAGYELAS